MNKLEEKSNSRICFIIPQFGMIPGYIDFFIIAAAYTHELIDFHFFTDQTIKINSSVKNVFVTRMTLMEFNQLAVSKLGHPFTIERKYKLCDMKPMYGVIFEDFLKHYQYWGHCDFDIIFGNLVSLLTRSEFNSFEIFTVQSLYASGPFEIFRNTARVNNFFKQSKSWKDVLDQPNYMGFDEAGDVIKEIWRGKDIKDCQGKIHSMTHLMKDDELLRNLDIRISMKSLITEAFQKGSTIRFKEGKLMVEAPESELFIYHYMNRKNRLLFNDLLLSKHISKFEFSDYGFTTGNYFEFWIGLVLSLIRRYRSRAVTKFDVWKLGLRG